MCDLQHLEKDKWEKNSYLRKTQYKLFHVSFSNTGTTCDLVEGMTTRPYICCILTYTARIVVTYTGQQMYDSLLILVLWTRPSPSCIYICSNKHRGVYSFRVSCRARRLLEGSVCWREVFHYSYRVTKRNETVLKRNGTETKRYWNEAVIK